MLEVKPIVKLTDETSAHLRANRSVQEITIVLKRFERRLGIRVNGSILGTGSNDRAMPSPFEVRA